MTKNRIALTTDNSSIHVFHGRKENWVDDVRRSVPLFPEQKCGELQGQEKGGAALVVGGLVRTPVGGLVG